MLQSMPRGPRSACLTIAFFALTAIPFVSCAKDAVSAEAMAADVPRLMALGDIPGLSVAVVRGDSLSWSGAFGITDVRTGEPVSTKTVFEAASLSKTLFSYVALRLIDRGVIDLDTPLIRYAPYPRLARDPRHRQVTARMCLNHTTGLPNWGTRFADEPGTRFTYSGEGIRFLRKTLEAATGQTLEDMARQEAFIPLGMPHSTYLWDDNSPGTLAAGHDAQGKPQPRRDCPGGSAAASLHTTANDYARFLQACLTGKGLSPESHATMMETSIQADFSAAPSIARHVGWGLGWGTMDSPEGPVIWQWGDNGDTMALAIGCPASGTGLVYFANSATGLSIAHALVAEVLPGRPWCLEALAYQRYDDPTRIRYFEQAAQQAFRAGQLVRASDCLETLVDLKPDHPWAATRLQEVRHIQTQRHQTSSGRS